MYALYRIWNTIQPLLVIMVMWPSRLKYSLLVLSVGNIRPQVLKFVVQACWKANFTHTWAWSSLKTRHILTVERNDSWIFCFFTANLWPNVYSDLLDWSRYSTTGGFKVTESRWSLEQEEVYLSIFKNF